MNKPTEPLAPLSDRTPTKVAKAPRPGALGVAGALASLIAIAAVACAQPGQNQVLPVTVLGLSESVAPIFESEQDVLYQVTTPVQFPMKPPSGDDAAKLAASMPPYPREPFMKAEDEHVDVRYVLTNLDDADRSIELLLDAWNEFVRYKPGINAGTEEAEIDLSSFDDLIKLPAKGRIEGVITDDDTHEMAVDLATAMAIMANPPADDSANPAGVLINRAMNRQNRSSANDPLISKYIPAVTAGLTGFDLSLRSREKLNVAVEIQVTVRAKDQKFIVEPGKDDPKVPVPGATLTPPPPPRE